MRCFERNLSNYNCRGYCGDYSLIFLCYYVAFLFTVEGSCSQVLRPVRKHSVKGSNLGSSSTDFCSLAVGVQTKVTQVIERDKRFSFIVLI